MSLSIPMDWSLDSAFWPINGAGGWSEGTERVKYLPQFDSWFNAGDFAFSCWFVSSINENTNSYQHAFVGTDKDALTSNGFYISMSSTAPMKFYSLNGTVEMFPLEDYNDGAFHHLVFSHTKATGEINMWLDRIPSASNGSIAPTNLKSNSTEFTLFNTENSPYYWSGTSKCWQFFSTAINQSEVNELHSKKGRYTPLAGTFEYIYGGTTAEDWTGTLGVITAPTIHGALVPVVGNDIDRVAKFDRTLSQVVYCPHHADITPYTGEFSISIWAKYLTLRDGTIYPAVFGKGDLLYSEMCLRCITEGGTMRFYCGGTGWIVDATGAVTANEWCHFVLTRGGGEVKIYCDNKLRNTATNSRNVNTTKSMHFGGADSSSSNYANVEINNCGFWKGRVLNRDEVTVLFANGKGLKYEELSDDLKVSLSAYWNFDDPNPLADSHTGDRVLYNTNGATFPVKPATE